MQTYMVVVCTRCARVARQWNLSLAGALLLQQINEYELGHRSYVIAE